MIDGTKLSPWTQIYTFVANDGRNIHIHSPRLREHCLRMKYPIVRSSISNQFALELVRDNSVSPLRVGELTAKHLLDPIIVCKTEAYGKGDPLIPDVLMVDGHHRYVWAALNKRKSIRTWLLEMHQWMPFIITNLRSQTKESLIAEPILPKPHWGKGAK